MAVDCKDGLSEKVGHPTVAPTGNAKAALHYPTAGVVTRVGHVRKAPPVVGDSGVLVEPAESRRLGTVPAAVARDDVDLAVVHRDSR